MDFEMKKTLQLSARVTDGVLYTMDLLLNQHISPYSLLEPVGKVCLSYPLNPRLVKKPASWKFYESNVSSTYKVGIPKDTFIKNVCGISSEGLFILPTSSPE